MGILVRSRAQYLTAPVEKMRREDFKATHLVKAVKGKGLSTNSYAWVTIGGWPVKINEANKDRAMDWFAAWAAGQITGLGPEPKVIVPIPSSKTTLTSVADFRTAIIAEKVAKLCPNTTCFPDLRFDREMSSSSEEGGTRDADELYQRLQLGGSMPAGQIILLDDVVTGGGHLIASARTIEDAGREVQHAVCCGRSTPVQFDDPFSISPETINT
jgi:hypothetical protein